MSEELNQIIENDEIDECRCNGCSNRYCLMKLHPNESICQKEGRELT